MTTTSNHILSRRIRSPEDICVGDFVAVTHTRYQYVPDNLEPMLGGTEIEPISLTALPYDAGTPMKVIERCLPFVIGETAQDARVVIDTRRHALTRVSEAYAMAAKPKPKKSEKKRKGKGKGKKRKKNRK
ncbi:MAG: hypothetical protein KTR15_09855 [Phycisphaeraceae bacterium]|nr:hypothetical protein [Phycisphaeraceae bacterium]